MEPKNGNKTKELLGEEMIYESVIEYSAIRFDKLKSLIDKQAVIVRRNLWKGIKEKSFNIKGYICRYVEYEFFVKNSPIDYIDWRHVDYTEEDVMAYQEQAISSLADIIKAYEEAAHRLVPI